MLGARRTLLPASLLALAVLAVPSAASAAPVVTTPRITSLSTRSAPLAGGTKITVTGSGFVHVATVLFGSTAGRAVSVRSHTRLTVTVPRHAAGAVDVRVVLKTGRTTRTSPRTRADRFTYRAAPVVSAVSPARGSTAGGRTVVITGRNFATITTVLFGGVRATRVTVTSAARLTAIVPRHVAGTVHVGVRGAFGTSASRSADRYAYVAPAPPSPVSMQGSTSTTTSVTLHWTHPGSATDPVIVRRATGTTAPARSGDGTAVAVLGDGDTSYTDDGLVPGAVYSYALFVHGATGLSAPADLTARTLAASDPRTWTGPNRPFGLPHGSPAAVSCTGATFCLAVDTFGAAFTFDGTGWTPAPRLDTRTEQNALSGVACFTPTDCLATHADSSVYHFDGTSWTGEVIAGVSEFTGLSCADPTFCVATTDEGQISVYRGTSWSAPTTVAPVSNNTYAGIETISCPSSTFCAAGDVFGRVVTFDGRTWSRPRALGTDQGPRLSCVSATSCLAVVGTTTGTKVVSFDGATWTPVRGVPQDLEPRTTTCVSATFCLVLGDHRAAVFDGSTVSDPEDIPADGSLPGAASCLSVDLCVALTPDGASLRTAAGWSDPASFDPAGGGVAVTTCSGDDFCVAADPVGHVRTRTASGWTDPVALGSPVNDLSCVSSSFCVAVTGNGASVFDGTTWSSVQSGVPSDDLSQVSCSTADFCLAYTDRQGYLFDGQSWTRAPTLDLVAVNDLSCLPGTMRCIVLGQEDFDGPTSATTFDGTDWSTPVVVASDTVLHLSCVDASLCVASGPLGVFGFDGSQWSGPTVLGGTVSDVSCATDGTCVAVGDTGSSVFDGTTWSTPSPVAADDTSGFRVSCGSRSLCLATDGISDVYQFS